MEAVKALVTISGMQAGENGPEDIRFATEGRFSKRGQAYKIEYDESELTGMAGAHTVIMANAKSVALKRVGKVESYLSFTPGKKQISYYNTEFGSFAVGVEPSEIDISLTDFGGSIHVAYNIEIDHVPSGRNMLDVTVKPIY